MKPLKKSAHKSLKKKAKKILEARRLARASYLHFIKFVWWKAWPFAIGRHTREICDAIDDAIDTFDGGRGESANLDINVPFGHGKSDLVSRGLVPYFLGRCDMAGLDADAILTGYGADLVEGFSKDAKEIIRSTEYQQLFPGVTIPRGDDSVKAWKVAGRSGRITAAGLTGGIMGKRGHLIVVDDYCKNRKEARSLTYRKATWAGFQDVLSRRHPVSIVIQCATSWHVDDNRARLRKAQADDPGFPRFRELKFPARNEDGSFLFPELFPPEWYIEQYAAQGTMAPALLGCEPVVEGGNRFKVDNVVFHDSLEEFPQGLYVRAWDLASSKKERDGDDPDFTVGLLGYVTEENVTRSNIKIVLRDLWIADVVFCREEAPERDALIQATAAADGGRVAQAVEAFGAYKDAYTTLKKVLAGVSTVHKSQLPGDKTAKCGPLEEPFNRGRVHMLRAPWNAELIKQFAEFPDGAHDDGPDAAAIVFEHFTKSKPSIGMPRQG